MLYLLSYTACETRNLPGCAMIDSAAMALQLSEGSILSDILSNYPIPDYYCMKSACIWHHVKGQRSVPQESFVPCPPHLELSLSTCKIKFGNMKTGTASNST